MVAAAAARDVHRRRNLRSTMCPVHREGGV